MSKIPFKLVPWMDLSEELKKDLKLRGSYDIQGHYIDDLNTGAYFVKDGKLADGKEVDTYFQNEATRLYMLEVADNYNKRIADRIKARYGISRDDPRYMDYLNLYHTDLELAFKLSLDKVIDATGVPQFASMIMPSNLVGLGEDLITGKGTKALERWARGENNGMVSDKFANEHPNWTTAINFIGDFAIPWSINKGYLLVSPFVRDTYNNYRLANELNKAIKNWDGVDMSYFHADSETLLDGYGIDFKSGDMPIEGLTAFWQGQNGRWYPLPVIPYKTEYVLPLSYSFEINPDLTKTYKGFSFLSPTFYSTGLSAQHPFLFNPETGQWGTDRFPSLAKEGKQDFIDWMNNSAYRAAAEANKEEAKKLGLYYQPTYDNLEYMRPINVLTEFNPSKRGTGGSLSGDDVTYNTASSMNPREVIAHEIGHAYYHGYVPPSLMGDSRGKLQYTYLKQKSALIFKPNSDYGGMYDLSIVPAEAAMNSRDFGKALGIEIGQPYPGDAEALALILSIPKDSPKAGLLDYFKLDKESLPYVWRALNGTLFSTILMLNNDKIKL